MNAIQALQTIAALGGNLPDESLTDRTGPNDAAHRGLMYTEARRLAREALEGKPSDPAKDQRYSLDLTRIGCGADGDARAERLKSALNGKTYMNFEVIASPMGGELLVSVEGTAGSQEEFTGMVLGVLADELSKTQGGQI